MAEDSEIWVIHEVLEGDPDTQTYDELLDLLTARLELEI